MLMKESQWFAPNHGEITKSLKSVFENYKNYSELVNVNHIIVKQTLIGIKCMLH
jgi:hypothetical protein